MCHGTVLGQRETGDWSRRVGECLSSVLTRYFSLCSSHAASRRHSVNGRLAGCSSCGRPGGEPLGGSSPSLSVSLRFFLPSGCPGVAPALTLSVQALPCALFWVTQVAAPGLGTNAKSRSFTLYPLIHMGPWSSWKHFFYWFTVLNFISVMKKFKYT